MFTYLILCGDVYFDVQASDPMSALQAGADILFEEGVVLNGDVAVIAANITLMTIATVSEATRLLQGAS